MLLGIRDDFVFISVVFQSACMHFDLVVRIVVCAVQFMMKCVPLMLDAKFGEIEMRD